MNKESQYYTYVVSISPKKETIRVIQKKYVFNGRKYKCTESNILSETSIMSIPKIETEKEVTTSYFHYGLQTETDMVKVMLYDFEKLKPLIHRIISSLEIDDFFFASKDFVTP